MNSQEANNTPSPIIISANELTSQFPNAQFKVLYSCKCPYNPLVSPDDRNFIRNKIKKAMKHKPNNNGAFNNSNENNNSASTASNDSNENNDDLNDSIVNAIEADIFRRYAFTNKLDYFKNGFTFENLMIRSIEITAEKNKKNISQTSSSSDTTNSLKISIPIDPNTILVENRTNVDHNIIVQAQCNKQVINNSKPVVKPVRIRSPIQSPILGRSSNMSNSLNMGMFANNVHYDKNTKKSASNNTVARAVPIQLSMDHIPRFYTGQTSSLAMPASIPISAVLGQTRKNNDKEEINDDEKIGENKKKRVRREQNDVSK